MRGRYSGRCHWRGCALDRVNGEFCEQHQKAKDFYGHFVKNPAPTSDGWDGYTAWMVEGDHWEFEN